MGVPFSRRTVWTHTSADAERQGQEGDGRETARLRQGTDRKANLTEQGGHGPAGTQRPCPRASTKSHHHRELRVGTCPQMGQGCSFSSHDALAPGLDRQTGTAKSRSAWLSDVFLSVLSERWPITRAQGTA